MAHALAEPPRGREENEEETLRQAKRGQPYLDEGQAAYEARYQALRLRTMATTAAQLGYELVKKPAPASA